MGRREDQKIILNFYINRKEHMMRKCALYQEETNIYQRIRKGGEINRLFNPLFLILLQVISLFIGSKEKQISNK